MKICLRCEALFDNESFVCPQCSHAPVKKEGFESFTPDCTTENAGFPEEAFEHLYDIEDRNFWFNARNKLILWTIAHCFPDAANFLEVGCGTGFVLRALANAQPDMHLIGGELSLSGLRCARKRLAGQARLIQMDARRMPFDAEFDLVGAFDVLEHLDDDEDMLAQIHRAVKPRGGIILTVPQHKWLWSNLDNIACHKRRYSKNELIDKIKKTGFECIYANSFMSLLTPLMIISRSRKMDVDKACRELAPPLCINHLLGAVAAIELLGVKLGVRYPIGGSILIAGIKTG